MMNNREKAILMIQSNILLAGKISKGNSKDAFNATRAILKLLKVELDTSEYIHLYNEVLSFNNTEIEELLFQMTNR
jgi:pyruvate formate-lyase activating enzyme-like uncharacterized protein